jgi:hypothetical protein
MQQSTVGALTRLLTTSGLTRLATMVTVGYVMLTPIPALSAVACDGHVGYVALGPAHGVLQVDYGYGIHYVCSIQTPPPTQVGMPAWAEAVSPSNCKGLYALFLSAQLSGKTVRVYFADPVNTCTQIGHWVWPAGAPIHIAIVN